MLPKKSMAMVQTAPRKLEARDLPIPQIADDSAILAATDETLDGGMISDATWAACAAHLKTAEERIELVVAIGNWTLFSQLLRSLKIPLEDGVVAWPPDGKKP